MPEVIDAVLRMAIGGVIGYSIATVLILKSRIELLKGENRILELRVRLLELKVEAQGRAMFDESNVPRRDDGRHSEGNK